MTEPSSDTTVRAENFEDFWRAYLRAHRRPENRGVHYFAATTGMIGFLLGVMSAHWWYVFVGVTVSYGMGSVGHLVFEHNHVLVQGRPIWSLICCYRMTFSALTGHLGEDLTRAGL